MDKKKIFGIIIFIIIGLFMFSFANPNDEVKLYDCGDDEKSYQDEVTTCVNEKMEDGTTEKKALSSCRKQYCEGNQTVNSNDNEKEEETTVDEVIENNQATEENTQEATVVNNQIGIPYGTTTDNNQTTDNSINNELENYKKEQIENINKYAENIDNTTDTLKDAEEKINNATSKEEVDKIVEETKETLDKLKQQQEKELEDYKNAAIEELKNYRKDYNYSDENKSLYDEIINEYVSKINNAATKEEVDELLKEGKNKIDELINKDLNSYKEEKQEEIENYVDSDKHRSEQQEEIKNIIKDAKEKIENATSKEEVDKIVEETKEALDKIKTDEELTKEETKTITFVDYDGTVLATQSVKIGKNATPPGTLVKGTYTKKYITYTFTKWDKDYTNIQDDMVIKAVYEATSVKANVYLLKEEYTKPLKGESLGTKAYTHITSVELNITDEIKTIIDKNKTTIISLDEETILSMIKENEVLPVPDKDFYIYNYYVVKYENADGFHIDMKLVYDENAANEYKNSAIETIKNYYESLGLTGEYDEKASSIVEETISKINAAVDKKTIDELKENAINDLKNILDEIKSSALKEIEEAIENAGFTGTYVTKANELKEEATNAINNATSLDEVNRLKEEYLNKISSLIELSKKTFVADINTKNIFKLKKLSITDIAEDVIINKITYVYPLNIESVKYANNEYNSSIILDEEINDRLFGSKTVKIEYTKDNVEYVNTYSVERNLLSSITGLKLVSTETK